MAGHQASSLHALKKLLKRQAPTAFYSKDRRPYAVGLRLQVYHPGALLRSGCRSFASSWRAVKLKLDQRSAL